MPPPGSMPSSSAERTAHTASSTLSYSSFCSRSVLPPTYITPIPPVSEAILDMMKSFSVFVFAKSKEPFSSATLPSIASWSEESSLRMTVEPRPTITLAAWPKSSAFIMLRSSPVFSEKVCSSHSICDVLHQLMLLVAKVWRSNITYL